MYTINKTSSARTYRRKVSRRMRRRIRSVRPHEWLQYFGLLMLVVGAAMLAYAALNI
jgi:hypothetical protein